MSEKNGKAPEQPVFNFGKVGHKWLRKFVKIERQLQMVDDPDEMDALMDARDGLLVQVIVDIPAGWLREDAPDAKSIEWSDVDSLDWIRAPRIGSLTEALTEAIQDARKN